MDIASAIGFFFSYLTTPQGQLFAEKMNAVDDKLHGLIRDMATNIHDKIRPNS